MKLFTRPGYVTSTSGSLVWCGYQVGDHGQFRRMPSIVPPNPPGEACSVVGPAHESHPASQKDARLSALPVTVTCTSTHSRVPSEAARVPGEEDLVDATSAMELKGVIANRLDLP
jgi:hypothetical protein